MELRHLRAFIAVAEEESLGRAAKRLHISQPPLTRQIQQLEGDLGVALFDRVRQRLRLTVAGTEFLAEARLVLAQAERARRTAQRAARGEIGRLGLGTVESATAGGILPAAVARFRRAFPQVECSILEAQSLSQVESIRSRMIDVGFIHTRPSDESGLAFRMVRRGRQLAVLRHDHPLAKRRTLPLALLAREPLLLWDRRGNPARYDQILRVLRATGQPARVVQQAVLMQSLCSFAAAGLGVALIPDLYATDRFADVTFRPVPELNVPINLELVWREDDSSAALAAFRSIVEELANESKDRRYC